MKVFAEFGVRLVLTLFFFLATRANANNDAYPPQSNLQSPIVSSGCKGESRDITYVITNNVMFRIPYDLRDREMIHPVGQSTSIKSIAQSNRQGCRSNPVPVWGLYLIGRRDSFLQQWPSDYRNALLSVNLFGQAGGRNRIQETIESSLISMSRDFPCEKYGLKLIRCGRGAEYRRSPIAFTVPLSIYSAPMGHPFIVMCDGDASIYNDICRVSYRVTEEYGLGYKFDHAKLPIDKVMELDRVLREAVMQMQVK